MEKIPFKANVKMSANRFEDADAFRDHFLTNPVSGNYCDFEAFHTLPHLKGLKIITGHVVIFFKSRNYIPHVRFESGIRV